MAHYAELDENNIVIRVIVINNSDELKDGVEDESTGAAFCAALTGRPIWKKTSYNNNIRKRYASIGFRYDPVKDVFVSLQPFPSWTLDENSDWQAPTPKPQNPHYFWNEAAQSWNLIPKPYESWILDDQLGWQPPTPMPNDGKTYVWNESALSWDLVVIPPQNNNGA